MVSRYSVIQYVPNPVSNERINIGVLAFDEHTVRVQFLSRWDRVNCFGSATDVGVLKDFARQMQDVTSEGLLFPGDKHDNKPRHERLLKVSQGWMNSIQFSEPSGSLDDVDSLLEHIADAYLLEPYVNKQKLRDRQTAARLAKTHVRGVLQKRLGEDRAKDLLRTAYSIKGRREQHKFDVTVANGKPFFVAHGISFEVHTPEVTMKSLSWMISDVKEKQPNFPLAVLALPPLQCSPEKRRMAKIYERTTATYEALGAEVLNEDQVDKWTSEQLDLLSN